MAIQYGSEMYFDKKSKMGTRELEQKYNCSRVAIGIYCKYMDYELLFSPASPLSDPIMIEKIKKFIDSYKIINAGELNAD